MKSFRDLVMKSTPGVGDGQGGLVCMGSQSRTQLSDWTELNWMKSTYLTLSGSVRNEVGNLDLLGAIGKITGSQPGNAFLPSVQLVGIFQK